MVWQPTHIKRLSKDRLGFTMIETIICLAVIGLMMGVTIPLVSSFSKAELRMASGRLSALIRDAYNQAALQGGTSRLVFDLDEGTITLEAQEKVQYLKSGGKSEEEIRANSLDKGENDKNEKEEEENNDDDEIAIGGETISKGELASLAAAMGLGPRTSSSAKISYAASDDEKTSYKLPEGVKIVGYWAEHLTEELHSGQVYLYFFSMGYTEEAIIYLSGEEEGTVYSLEVEPLTGRVNIHDERIAIP